MKQYDTKIWLCEHTFEYTEDTFLDHHKQPNVQVDWEERAGCLNFIGFLMSCDC